uniref:Uncharacterized protein n=1 Tax=Tolypothrix bouteillei VB521301 TaxID=1479485 RepID=A0A0C1RQ05_9CYAN
MELFVDFTPYPGSRILIANLEKFEHLALSFPTPLRSRVGKDSAVKRKAQCLENHQLTFWCVKIGGCIFLRL